MSSSVGYDVRILISCPDKKGLIAAISSFIAMHDGNVLSADQYVSMSGRFFMRLEIEGKGFGLEREEFGPAFAPPGPSPQHRVERLLHRCAEKNGHTRLTLRPLPHRLALALGRGRTRSRDTAHHLQPPGPRFAGRTLRHSVPPSSGYERNKVGAESAVMDLLYDHDIDLVVLARYMQILSPKLVNAYPERLINIHHSFLPAFVGADPYRRAHERGREDHWCDGPLRHRRPRRRPNNPPGRFPRYPPRNRGRPGPSRPGDRTPRPGPRRPLAPRRPNPGRRKPDGNLRVAVYAADEELSPSLPPT